MFLRISAQTGYGTIFNAETFDEFFQQVPAVRVLQLLQVDNELSRFTFLCFQRGTLPGRSRRSELASFAAFNAVFKARNHSRPRPRQNEIGRFAAFELFSPSTEPVKSMVTRSSASAAPSFSFQSPAAYAGCPASHQRQRR